MNVNEYAERKSVSPQAVRKAIAAGRLKASVVQDRKGKYDIDPRVADLEWEARCEAPIDGAEAEPTGSADDRGRYLKARADREERLAMLSDMLVRERAGELCEVQKVAYEYAVVASADRQERRGLASLLRSRCELTPAQFAAAEAEIRRVQGLFAESVEQKRNLMHADPVRFAAAFDRALADLAAEGGGK